MKALTWMYLIPAVLMLCLLVNGCSPKGSRPEMDDQSVVALRQTGLDTLLNDTRLWTLGERIFFDTNLSEPPGQSCATCHGPEVGWTGPDSEVNIRGGVYPGAAPGRFGDRKPNSAAYATLAPPLQRLEENGEFIFVGGNFWDGRATGHLLGNPAADQAQGPFLNPLEQNLSSASEVIGKICASDYADLFRETARSVWGIDDICRHPDTTAVYGMVAIALAAFEHSPAVNAFSSKYDLYLAGKVQLSEQEAKGLALFEGKALCSQCHPSRPGPDGTPPLFTDFTFENPGFPRNPDHPFYGMPGEFNPDGPKWKDQGLGAVLLDMPQYAAYADQNMGRHQVPTLRNVDKRPSEGFVKAFGHNGYFKRLEDVVHFYNTRDVLPPAGEVDDPQPGINCWPEPEVAENMNRAELGNLGLNNEEEAALVAFLSTLSDGYGSE